jgi:MFS family permease
VDTTSRRSFSGGSALAALASWAKAASVCLARPQLRRLELSWLGFNLADMAVTVALGVYAFEIGGVTAVGLITVARTLPAIFSGPLFSVATDRLSRRSVLAIGYWGRAVATGLMTIALVVNAPIGVLYLLAPLDIILASSVYPASAALIPELSRKPEELGSANAVFTLMENIGSLVGPLIAAGLMALAGIEAVFVASVTFYVMAAFATRSLASDRTIQSMRGIRLMAELKGGLTILRRHWDARTVLIAWTLVSMLLGVLEVAIVVVALDLLRWDDAGVGLLAASVGIGGVIGATLLAVSSRTRAYGRAMVFALVLFGLGLAGASVAVVLTVTLAMVVIGYAVSQADVAGQTLLQRTTPGDSLGRVLGLLEGSYWAAVGIGALIGSLVIDWLGLVSALLVFAVLAGTLALAFIRPLRRIDAEASVAQDRVALFGQCGLFTALPIPTVEYLASHATEAVFSPSEKIIVQGEHGDDVYVIVEGEVGVEVEGREVTTLYRGDYFGEIALLYDTPRTATVRAHNQCRTLSFDGPTFVAAVSGYVGSSEMVSEVADARIAESRQYRRDED